MPYALRRSRRRRTLGLTVTPQEVRIHAPVWTPRDEIETYVIRQREWLTRAWQKMQARVPCEAASRVLSVSYLGQTLSLELHPALFPETVRRGRVLHLYAAPGADPHALARDWLLARAGRLLA
ncbi:MAG: M48 family metallopeptidase, partial [Thiobacillus sp.]|nr:M48 family metallopeptidase [Thiobacillus sp.]